MAIDYKLIGRRISQLRKEADLTQEELASLADVSAQYLSLVENGRKKVSLRVLAAICEGLSVSSDELIFGMANAPSGGPDEWGDIITDCTRFEREVMIETAMALKKVLRRYEKVK